MSPKGKTISFRKKLIPLGGDNETDDSTSTPKVMKPARKIVSNRRVRAATTRDAAPIASSSQTRMEVSRVQQHSTPSVEEFDGRNGPNEAGTLLTGWAERPKQTECGKFMIPSPKSDLQDSLCSPGGETMKQCMSPSREKDDLPDLQPPLPPPGDKGKNIPLNHDPIEEERKRALGEVHRLMDTRRDIEKDVDDTCVLLNSIENTLDDLEDSKIDELLDLFEQVAQTLNKASVDFDGIKQSRDALVDNFLQQVNSMRPHLDTVDKEQLGNCDGAVGGNEGRDLHHEVEKDLESSQGVPSLNNQKRTRSKAANKNADNRNRTLPNVSPKKRRGGRTRRA
ncbi:hypothetical protein C8Q75DRAFT_215685 [Abortiporus biennis]|nr:hypothetical protein C8Q75DRAFT_215685 [Abortiporus biennis]